jgi:hypothetical protein
MIFKSGHAVQQFLFVEAFSHAGRWFSVPKDSALGMQAARALTSASSLRRGAESLIPIVGQERACTVLKGAVHSLPGFAGGQPRVLGLVYLSSITTVYASKKGQRQRMLVDGAGEQFGELRPKSTVLGTIQINIA